MTTTLSATILSNKLYISVKQWCHSNPSLKCFNQLVNARLSRQNFQFDMSGHPTLSCTCQVRQLSTLVERCKLSYELGIKYPRFDPAPINVWDLLINSKWLNNINIKLSCFCKLTYSMTRGSIVLGAKWPYLWYILKDQSLKEVRPSLFTFYVSIHLICILNSSLNLTLSIV
jgi:hypothetical protein